MNNHMENNILETDATTIDTLVRETFHNSIKFLLDPLFTNDDDGDGIELKINNKIFWFFLRVSTIICDWLEAYTFSLTYKLTNSNYPYHFCLVSKENLNNTRLRDDQMVLRNKENMLQYYNNSTTEKVSLEPVFNYFWNIPNINVYIATVPDRMHHLDLGLYRYQIEFTKKLLFKAEGKSLVDKMNWRITLISRVSTIICDWLEAYTFSLTYKLTNSNYPYHFCLVSKENLNNTRLRDDQMVLRNKENMLQYYNNSTTEKVSLEPVFNYFWNIPNINVYIATVPDRMHHLDLGLYRYQIEFTKKLLFKAEGKSLVDKMNWRITLISRYPELKIFSGRLQSIVLLTANNYRNIMKVMVFVVDDLLNKNLSEVYVKWNKMYLLSRQETFKESDLKNFQEVIEK
ncbi:hypothetical protein Glove_108g29 [Diversispora epigaea]|uniref:Uncharacterized protein n=1 Tax=Diversispora epigaea TaxID=1348612 RepID=A0A397JC98_9GLOM|nr:hypothetical protein Glove_108g29 [Diversispora epigaea]